MLQLREFRLNTLPVSGKLLCTFFLTCVGIGFVFCQLNVFISYHMADGSNGLSIKDIEYVFYGQPDVLLVEAKLNGSMAEHLEYEDDRKALINWARRGAKKEKFKDVKNIIVKKCLRCHTAGGEAGFAPYDKLSIITETFTRINRGVTVKRLITLSHIHMFSIGAIFALNGVIFFFTTINEKLKMALIIFPFGSLMMDIFSWWLTKLTPVFAVTVFVGGILTVIAFLVQFVISLISIWSKRQANA